MSPKPRQILKAMLLTGVILTPAVRSDALTDFSILQTTIDSGATTIGDQTNSSRNWGFIGGNTQQIGTADLVQNISTTILKAKFNVDTDPITWINATNATNIGQNLTTLDEPYINYISAIPNLSTALTALGRSWHSEMNKPVSDAIDALEQTITAFQTSLLSAGVIHTNSTLRTIRASSSLSDAQTAWSRLLNFPGSASSSSSERRSIPAAFHKRFQPVELAQMVEAGATRRTAEAQRHAPPVPLTKGEYYTHKDLWGREHASRQSNEGNLRYYNRVVRREEYLAAQQHSYASLDTRYVTCKKGYIVGSACHDLTDSAPTQKPVHCDPSSGPTCAPPASAPTRRAVAFDA